ncbi:DUF6161 domain-containing protein [Ralstonia pseudosolanacearum]|uniref:DUF6161 domain-containing protein n=1 Tax=Ralstonia pseudosolanacearum TaxID=1310165 RepID=UPI003AB0CBE3
MHHWIQTEVQAWSWLSSVGAGNHKGAIDLALQPLREASNLAQQAVQHETSNPDATRQYISQAQGHLQTAYITNRLPHSSSSLGIRVDGIRVRDPLEAIAYLYTFLPPQNYQFDARDISSWRGFLAGLHEQFELANFPQQTYQATLKNIGSLETKLAKTLGEKTEAYNALHRHYAQVSADIDVVKRDQAEEFAAFLENNQKSHDDALAAHQEGMTNLEAVFREKMSLRAPVEYWEERSKHHKERTTVSGWWAFGAMAVLTVFIGVVAAWVLHNLSPEGKPEVWRVSVLVLVGVLGVWATRLLVRIFLSHIHLATDAAERVVMVKTYLSLLESGKLFSDEDRKLILQALFRPASDGIVKDEGLPHPALEALTKLGSR